MIILGLYLVRQRHLVSTFCVHIIVHTLLSFICYRFTASQYHYLIIDNKFYLQYDFVVSFTVLGTIGLYGQILPRQDKSALRSLHYWWSHCQVD